MAQPATLFAWPIAMYVCCGWPLVYACEGRMSVATVPWTMTPCLRTIVLMLLAAKCHGGRPVVLLYHGECSSVFLMPSSSSAAPGFGAVASNMWQPQWVSIVVGWKSFVDCYIAYTVYSVHSYAVPVMCSMTSGAVRQLAANTVLVLVLVYAMAVVRSIIGQMTQVLVDCDILHQGVCIASVCKP